MEQMMHWGGRGNNNNNKQTVFTTDKPVVSEEDVVSLIMECYGTTALEFWFIMEKCR